MMENKKFLKDKESLESSVISESSTLDDSPSLEHPNAGAALDLLYPLIRYGQFSTAFSYSLHSSSRGKVLEYITRRPRIWGILTGVLYFIICLHMSLMVVKFNFSVSHSKLVNMIKRVTYGVFVVKLVIVYYCLHRRKKMGLWIKILKQADLIQGQFIKFGIPFAPRNKAKAVATGVCIFSMFLSLVHVGVFSFKKCRHASITDDCHWYDQYTNKMLNTLMFGFWNEDWMYDIPNALNVICGIIGLIMETFCWNLWYYVDAFRVLTSLIVWTVFRNLNRELAKGNLGIANLSDVMDLHYNGTKLLNLLNQLMAPITLSSTVFNILYVCFWTNYCLINFEYKFSHIVAVITFLRMVVVFYFVADVNTQAHQISTWIENNFTELSTLDKVGKKMDKTKLTLFTCLIYSKESIGFKGMHFFTCTPALNIAIGGLVLTYTVIVNQLATN